MKGKLLLVVLSLTLLVVFPGLSFAQSGSISGVVTDEVTGYPIAGAAITLSGIYCVWHTDSTGHYLCDSIPAGAYIVTAYATGYIPETYPDSVIVIEGQNSPHIDFALTPSGGGTGSISGRVTDEVTGHPIAGAVIGLSDLDCDCVWFTDSTGYYVCDHIPPGAYLVYASVAGYYPETYPESVTVVGGQNTPNIDFALAPQAGHGMITGRVTDEVTGLAIIMARVRAIGLDNYCYGEAWSDTGGYYGILNLCPGTYQVIASKQGYAPEVYPDSVIVISGENTPNIDFDLSPIGEYGSISGVVTDEITGAHISSAHLLVVGLDNWCFAEAWSDTDGYYLVPQLCPGTYEVRANKPGYIPETYPDPVVVIAGENTPDVDFALTPEGGPEFGSISGRITDEVTGLPIIMAHVTAVGMGQGVHGEAWSDSGGYYMIQYLCPDAYLVNAGKPGYVPETYPDSVIVTAGQNTPNIDFALTPEGGPEYGSISGRVTDEQTGLPIVMAHLMAIGLDNWCYGEAWSDTSGYYSIQNMCPGMYQVSARKMGYVPETYPDSVVVIAGEDTPGIDFALAPAGEPGSISGTVTDANTGDPIFGAHVWAHGEFGHGQAFTDSLGRYTIANLFAGDYFVSAWAPEYHPQDYPTPVAVIEGEDTPGIDFALIPCGGPGEGVIAGVVLEDTTYYQPIPYAMVFAVSWNGNWGFDLTDSTGMYMIEGLHVDDYYVFALAPGYMGEFYDGVYSWEEATLVTPDAYDIDFFLAPCGYGEGRISGVINSEGSPLEGASVYAYLDEQVAGYARSSSEGGYVINGLLPGTYTVSASMVSYYDATYPDPVEVVYGKASGVNIELPPVQVGDVTGEGVVDIGDVVFLINYLYQSGAAPNPINTGDVNCDEVVNVGDIVYLINYLYKAGPAPCSP